VLKSFFTDDVAGALLKCNRINLALLSGDDKSKNWANRNEKWKAS